jgi:DNA-binding winged helix-turn-helix (wHTH) protein
VVSRSDLEDKVWTGMIVTDDAVTSAIIKLRKAFGDNAKDPRFIATVPKRGYQLIAAVRKPATDAGDVAVVDRAGTPIASTASWWMPVPVSRNGQSAMTVTLMRCSRYRTR